jgi:hypothetical protein
LASNMNFPSVMRAKCRESNRMLMRHGEQMMASLGSIERTVQAQGEIRTMTGTARSARAICAADSRLVLAVESVKILDSLPKPGFGWMLVCLAPS